jgi:type VI secretion system protein ImpA
LPISVTSFGDAAPSGENLEYEKVFTDLMLVAQPGEERQAGEEIIAASEPEPKAIVRAAEAVLEQSHDLRAAILYGYAKTRIDGFPGLAEATGYIRAALTDFWDSCHPQLDAEDDNDPTMRVNAVRNMTDPTTFLRAVRRAPLTESRAFGMLSLRDLAIIEGEASMPADMETPPTAQAMAAAFQDTPPERLKEFQVAAAAALDDVLAINAVFDEQTPGQGPALDKLIVLLKKAAQKLADEVGVEDEPEAAAEGAPAEPGAAPAAPSAAPPGAINSPRDVEAALDRIIRYYETHEPSSPLPIILTRARRLVGADFMTIVNDLAPLGADNVRMIGGMENPE